MPLGLVVWILLSRAIVAALLSGRTGFIVTTDSVGYLQLAHNLLNTHHFSSSVSAPFIPEISRVPGYPAFLALATWISRDSLSVVSLIQCALSAATLWIGWRWISEVASPRSAGIGVILWSLDLMLAFHTPQILTEALFLFIFVAALWATHRAAERGTGLVASGLSWTLCIAIKPAVLFLPLFLAPFWRRRPGHAAAFLLAAYLFPIAWVARNTSVAGFRGYTTQGGVDLLRYPAAAVDSMVNKAPWPGHEARLRERIDAAHPAGYASAAERSRVYGGEAKRILLSHPWLTLRWCAIGTLRILLGPGLEMFPLAFLGGTDSLLQQASTGAAGGGTLQLLRTYRWLWSVLIAYEAYLLFFYGAFVIGCLRLLQSARFRDVALILGVFLYLLMISNHQGYYRYRIPLLPLMAAGAAWAFRKPSDRASL